MADDLQHWTPRPRPATINLQGRYTWLEKLDPARHGDELYDACTTSEAETRFTWLPETAPQDPATFRAWVENAAASTDPLYFAIIDAATGKVAGRQTLMRIDAANGCIEIGNIYWDFLIARRPAATEALFLFARYVFDDLGYRRFEWKCNNDNTPSKNAALRFGFQHEGVFRQHMVVKGRNRDTAWFAMTDSDWARLKPAYEAWLAPDNFDAEGQQKKTLQGFRSAFGA